MAENLDATSFDSNSSSGESEVDDLIAGALKELDVKPKEEKKDETPLKATPMAPVPVKPQPEKNVPKQAVKEQKEISPESKAYEETFKDFKEGATVTGTIAKIDPSGALVDIGYKSDGWIENNELTPGLKVGDKINVLIEKLETKEGYVLLSKKKADFETFWINAYEAYKNKSALEAKVTGAVKGGLVVDCGGIRGFIPASQVSKPADMQLEQFVGKILPVKIIEINRRQGKIVLSHKLGAIEHVKQEASKILDEIEVGQVRQGVVTSIKNFGAFVDLGGVEGLIHLSELSWKRVKHPSEVLKSGQKLDVFVLGVDQINKKVSLGLKELQPDPWATVLEKYRVGQTVKVKVLRIAKFGAFAEIEEGLEGLIHLSELSKEKVSTPEDVVKPGDVVDVKILRIIPEEQKIGLSIKDVQIEKDAELVKDQKQEETRVTLGDMIAEKERLKAERETSDDEIHPSA